MKLDLIQPQTGIPPAAPYEKASMSVFAAPTEVVAQGAEHFAGVGLSHLEAIRRAEEFKKLVRVRTEANKTAADIEGELDALHSSLKFSELDPDAFTQKWQDGKKAIEATVKDRVKYPETSALLEQRLPAIYHRYDKSAATHADELLKGNLGAQTASTIDTLKAIAGNVPLHDDAAFSEVYQRADNAAKESGLWSGAKAAELLREKTRKEMFFERARRAADESPDTFRDDMARGRFNDPGGKIGLDAEKRNELLVHADSRINARRVEEDRVRNEAERIYDKQVTRLQDQTAVSARQRYDAGTLTQQWLNDAAEIGAMKSEKFEHFSTLLANPKEVKADPETLRTLGLEIYKVRPDRDGYAGVQQRVWDAIGAQRVPYKGVGEVWLNHLEARMSAADSKATAKSERDETRERSDQHFYHAQVEKQLAEDLRTKSPLEALSQEGQSTYANALRELSTVSKAMGGSQDPRDWYDKRRLGLISQVSDAAKNRLEAMKRDLGNYPTIESIDRARRQKGEQEYYRLLERFRDVKKMEIEIMGMDALTKGKK